MDQGIILDLAQQAIWVTLKISTPVMMIGLFVGVAIGLLQALTQIQEMTLSFVPKILAIFLALFALFPFMGSELATFTRSIADQMIGMPLN
ncbi:MAG: flagellar biosynthesis protein FliQ [Alphaproteobacteria bacterium]|nr:flagellar biosynthesis protein FliQ [Alphaproteobacteria bacterium]USO08084.1 MAG: flagellar biosynthesis protein FliQ [Rhodospirillales bacterium]